MLLRERGVRREREGARERQRERQRDRERDRERERQREIYIYREGGRDCKCENVKEKWMLFKERERKESVKEREWKRDKERKKIDRYIDK